MGAASVPTRSPFGPISRTAVPSLSRLWRGTSIVTVAVEEEVYSVIIRYQGAQQPIGGFPDGGPHGSATVNAPLVVPVLWAPCGC